MIKFTALKIKVCIYLDTPAGCKAAILTQNTDLMSLSLSTFRKDSEKK